MKKNQRIICHINSAFYPGMGKTAFYEFTRCLSNYYNVQIISLARENEKNLQKLDNLLIHRISVKPLYKKTKKRLAIVVKIFQIVKKNKPDLCHVYYFPFCFLLPFAFRCLRINKKIKWILDIRSTPVVGKFLKVRKLIRKLHKPFFNKVLCINQAVKEDLFGDNRNIGIAGIGVNLNLFQRKECGLREKFQIKNSELVFTHLGTITETRKAGDILLAFQQAQKNISGIKLILIGEGDDKKRLEELAKKMRAEDKIIFTGYVEYEKVPQFLSMCDIGISYVPITSTLNKQPLLKNLEYFACGLPIIATRTSQNRLIIKESVNGWLIDDSVESLSTAIAKAASSKNTIKKFAENAVKEAQRYSWENIVKDSLVKIYNELI